MQLAVGTSGYAYKEWKGSFYPEDLRQDQMLSYYAERLPAVEINNTFYRMPSESVLLNWASQVPEHFTFVLKASQRITHHKRLRDVGDSVEYFFRTASVLGPRLGPTLFQLPPNFKKDVARLEAFLALLPEGCRCALEFRHPSWFDDEVYDPLRRRGVALCWAEADALPPVVATTGFGYLRLRREQYADDDLRAWAARVHAQPWSTAYVFFKHEDAGTGPTLARRFAQLFQGT